MTRREFKRSPGRPAEARALRFSALSLGILAASLTACAGAPVVTATPSSSCATLLPPEWKQGVAGAPLPQGDTVSDWEVFADAQTGKLDQANGRTVDAIGIVERCEARDASAIKKATHRFLGIF